MSLGLSKRVGRRPARCRTAKTELCRVLTYLYSLGLGGRQISRLTGYSHTMISLYAKDWGLDSGGQRGCLKPAALEALFPENIRADLRLIRTRSAVARERYLIREGLSVPNRVHLLVDDEDEIGVNHGAEVRPEETEPA